MGRGRGLGRGLGRVWVEPPPPIQTLSICFRRFCIGQTSLVPSISIRRLDNCKASWEKKCYVFKSAFGEWYTIYVLQWDIFYAGSTSAWYYIFRLGVWCRCKDCLVFFGSSVFVLAYVHVHLFREFNVIRNRWHKFKRLCKSFINWLFLCYSNRRQTQNTR